MTTILARRLAEARRMRGISAVEVAGRADVAPGNLSNLEAGRVLPGVDALHRLADALDVDTDWLLGRTDEPTSRSRNAFGLTARISELSDSDRRLVDLYLDTLEARRRGDGEDPLLRIRRRIEAVRNKPKD